MGYRVNMDGLTFTSEVVKSLAWPVSVILLVFLLRKPILELVPLIKKLKYKELELEFSQQVMDLKVEARSAFNPEVPGVTTKPVKSKALELVSISTRSAIIEAWIELETVAMEVAMSFWSESHVKGAKSIPRLGEYLFKCKVIDEKQLNVFNGLRKLRNKAAHTERLYLNENNTKSFIAMASELSSHISKG